MNRKEILDKYGDRGITQFELAQNVKALVSDETQITLSIGNGMLTGVTRGYMRGIGGRPENYVHGAYMRVAPIALLMAGYKSRGKHFYDIPTMDRAGAEMARVAHMHPLGFLPAAMLTHLLYKLVPLSVKYACREIEGIALETIDSLDAVYKGEFKEDKQQLGRLTRYAISLAKNNRTDAENIQLLGKGKNGEETWTIALYCAIRHVDNIEEAIIASVNHDGNSVSTGFICGNIMGAIYGYETIKRQCLFCPQGHELERTIELSSLIIALADDLYTSCIINEWEPIDTPEKQQWYEKYCKV